MDPFSLIKFESFIWEIYHNKKAGADQIYIFITFDLIFICDIAYSYLYMEYNRSNYQLRSYYCMYQQGRDIAQDIRSLLDSRNLEIKQKEFGDQIFFLDINKC